MPEAGLRIFGNTVEREATALLALEHTFAPPEKAMRRAAFLLTAAQECARTPENILRHGCNRSELEIRLTDIDACLSRLERCSAADHAACTSSLLDSLLRFEEILERVRRAEGVELDSQHDIGQRVLDIRERIMWALFGGGVWGTSQLGIADELRKKGIPIHRVAGASMGAVVGGGIAMSIGDHHQLENDGLATLIRMAERIETKDQLCEMRDGVALLPFDRLLDLQDEGGPSYEDLMQRTSQIPYAAQVRMHAPDGHYQNEVFLCFSAGTPMREILGVQKAAAASAANKKMFDHDRVGNLSDDTSIWHRSNTACVQQLRRYEPTLLLGAVGSFIDSDLLKWALKIRQIFSARYRDQGDFVFRPKEWHGVVSGKMPYFGKGTLTNFQRGTIPMLEFIQAGRESTRNVLPHIIGRLGLIPLHRKADQLMS